MFIGEKKIDRPFRWGIVGGVAAPALATSIVWVLCETTPRWYSRLQRST